VVKEGGDEFGVVRTVGDVVEERLEGAERVYGASCNRESQGKSVTKECGKKANRSSPKRELGQIRRGVRPSFVHRLRGWRW